MNEHLEFGPGGERIMLEYEGDKNGLPHTEAYLCPAMVPTIAVGNTEYEDGTPVKMGDKITLERAWELYRWKIENEYSRYVRQRVTVPLTQNQFDAHVLLVYNIGPGNYQSATCSALRFTNEERFDDAAASFAKWNKGKKYRPTESDLNRPALAYMIGTDEEGEPYWIGPDGQKADHFLRGLFGLVRREHATACLFMGFDHEEATRTENLWMTTNHPAIWDSPNNRWIDRVKYTPFSEVRKIAEKYPLKHIAPRAVSEPIIEDAVNKRVEPVPVPVPVGYEEPAEPTPAPVKRPPTPYRDYDPTAEAKDIAFSKRVWGFVLLVWGWFQTGLLMVAELPIVSELAAMSPMSVSDWRIGLLIIMAGLLLMWVGKVTAKSPLK